MATNSFGARSTLTVDGKAYTIHKLEALEKHGFSLARMPYSIKVMIENVLRREDGVIVTTGQIEALARWNGKGGEREVSFMPARVLLQDFTGVPVVADLAVMRDAIKKLGGNPAKISPLQPVDLVIDHSVQVDSFGSAGAFAANAQLEFERNQERYLFLRWGQGAFDNFRVVPPDTGIVHQVNLEYLAPVVFSSDKGEAYPDTVIGTDSHTTMINGLGVVGWGVGGIEAEAAMLGRSMPMLIPEVIGFRLAGALRPGATATDLVLTVTQMLRKKGVVGKFVEYFGPGLKSLPVADRATLGNMSPEYGATMGYFPVDDQTLTYLRLTGRSESQIKLIEAYCKAQGLFNSPDAPEPKYTDTLELDLGSVVPSMAGPRRPQDRVALTAAKSDFRRELAKEFEGHPTVDAAELTKWVAEGGNGASTDGSTVLESKLGHIAHKVEVNSEEGRFRVDARLDRHRGDYQLHQHVQSVGDAGGGAARAESCRARADGQAVGEDQSRAGIEGRHAVPEARGADGAAREAALQPGRLRMHDLYRQQRADCGGDCGRGEAGQPGRVRDSQRQSQFRRADQSRRTIQLPGVAAAGGRIRDCRHDGYRRRASAARHRLRRAPGVSARHLAVAGGSCGGGDRLGSRVDVQERVRPGVRRRRAMEEPAGARGQPVPLGARIRCT